MTKITAKTNLSIPQIIFLVGCLIFLSFNTFSFLKKIQTNQEMRKHIPFYFQGLKFSGLEDILRDVPVVGYLTDKDLALTPNAAQFAQAQYTIAPIILDLNYGGHEFILLDCSSEQVAKKKIADLRLLPLRKNNFGVILAKRKP